MGKYSDKNAAPVLERVEAVSSISVARHQHKQHPDLRERTVQLRDAI